MESLNRIELVGFVGTARVFPIGDTNVARFSVATNYCYKDNDGSPIIETTWHNVVAFEGKDMPDFHKLEQGKTVHVIGRLRKQKYIDANGNDRETIEVIANKIEIN